MKRMLLVAVAVFSIPAVHIAAPPHRMTFARIGPVQTQLFIANADGSAERAMLPAGLDYSPGFAGNEWVVFTSERNGSADIYRARLDGSGLERLTDHPAYDDQAAPSPDGQTIAFVSTRGHGKANLWVLDVKTRQARVLTPGTGNDFRPSWSPNGEWIAFTSDRNTEPGRVPGQWEHLQSTRLYVVRRDGSGLKTLTRGRGVVGTPRWSTDGTQVFFYETTEIGAWHAQRGDAAQGITYISSVDVATGVHKQHTTGNGVRLWPQPLSTGGLGYLLKFGGGEAHLRVVSKGGQVSDGPRGPLRNPSWSSDGTRVVYYKVMPGSFTMGPTFSRDPEFELTRITGGNFPAFSPDGTRLAAGMNLGGTRALVAMNADGTERTTLVQREGLSAFAPVWSPDGKQIAFSLGVYFRAPGRPRAEVGIINADGTGLRSLVADDANNGFPSWSPDGSRIVYKKDNHLVILTLATGASKNLTEPGPQHDNFPQWSPKGDSIMFTSDRDGDEDFRLYLIRPDGTGLRKLTDSPGDAHSIWSTDGEWIVFSSARMGFKDERALSETIPQPYGELFIIRPNGSGLRQLTDNQWEDATPAWKPAAADRRITAR
jgi:TolB protein